MSALGRPTVVKLGGSLSESGRIASILKMIGRARVACVIVPGGGVFADTVRAAQAEHGFSQAVAHRMAILAMHQTGMMLCAMHARLQPAETLAAIRRAISEFAHSRVAAAEALRWRYGHYARLEDDVGRLGGAARRASGPRPRGAGQILSRAARGFRRASRQRRHCRSDVRRHRRALTAILASDRLRRRSRAGRSPRLGPSIRSTRTGRSCYRAAEMTAGGVGAKVRSRHGSYG